MKIVHLCIEAPYNDYWGYQDNLLPKYQRRLGHEVTVITTNTTHADGGIITVPASRYRLSDGQQIIRLDYAHFFPLKLANLMRRYPVYQLLCEIRPDFVMVHGLANCTALQVRKYVKKCNPGCRVIADNHLDIYNGYHASKWKERLYFAFYRKVNRKMQEVYETVYGVTPARVEYQERYFGILPEKSKVLPMGADDEVIDFENREEIRRQIRTMYGIAQSDFLIVSGGKIDREKRIDVLMRAVDRLHDETVQLIVFGNALEDMKPELERMAKSPSVSYIGWIAAEKAYDFFMAADLVVFPGSHSVLWEQACACAVPCVFHDLNGMHHVDIGGNCEFISGVDEETLSDALRGIVYNKDKYTAMKAAACGEGRNLFLYSKIAAKVLLEQRHEHN